MHGIQTIHLVVQIMFISSSHMLITSRNGVTLYVSDFALRISAASNCTLKHSTLSHVGVLLS